MGASGTGAALPTHGVSARIGTVPAGAASGSRPAGHSQRLRTMINAISTNVSLSIRPAGLAVLAACRSWVFQFQYCIASTRPAHFLAWPPDSWGQALSCAGVASTFTSDGLWASGID